MRSNSSLDRTVKSRGRAVLAVDGMVGGAEWASCPAGQFSR
jgi:hypothetical protein